MKLVHFIVRSFTFFMTFFVVKTRVFGLFFEKNEVSNGFFSWGIFSFGGNRFLQILGESGFGEISSSENLGEIT